MQLSNRKQKILACIVDEFLSVGEPVGSKLIAQQIGVSPATVRNEMAELIELGFLSQPHTSAGRIPSSRGYREYVKLIANDCELTQGQKHFFDAALLSDAYDIERLLLASTRALSFFTKCVSVVSTSGGSTAKIRAVQFVQIARRTAMLILMSSAGTVKSEIFHCDFDLTPQITQVLFRAFNEKLVDVSAEKITMPFIQTLAASLGELSFLAGSALIALLKAAQKTAKAEIHTDGQMNLLFYPDFTDGQIKTAVDFLKEDENISLIVSGETNKLKVMIGDEISRSELQGMSLITTRYFVDNVNSGAVAVLGPVRMAYSDNIAAVRYVSNQLEEMLSALIQV